jgi:RNA polymerase sigma-70 factor (ECF subfamily)
VVREDDEHEFDALYRRLSPRMMGQAYAMTGSTAAAEDLVQEAFGRAWVRWSRVRRLENPEAWIRRVMVNQAISDWRKRSRPEVLDPRLRPGEVTEVDAIWLADALRTLPRNQCRAVVLHDAAGLTVPEISRQLRVPSGTVKSWISRGRTRLAILLDDSREDARHVRR